MTADNAIQNYLVKNEANMFALLEKLVLIQSGSYHKKGVDRVARMIESEFESNTVSCRTMEQKDFGDHLIVRSLCENRYAKQLLLVGHMDTVFPEDTDFNWYKMDESRCYGPGVIDMKGGLVTGIFALKALDFSGFLKKLPVAFIFNSDEEIGSPTSRELIQNEARKSVCAFVLECGGLKGEIVTGRKGNLSVRLDVTGRAGHAAFAQHDKASAILELAHKTIAVESLNDFERGITANVGKIKGGIGPNTVAEHASARVDLRFPHQKDLPVLEKKIYEIAATSTVPNTGCDLRVISGRPPMEQREANQELFRTVKSVADRLGFPVREEFRYGVSDANIIAQQGVPVLDGLGPSGAKDHSKEEYMIKASLLQRAALLAASIIECLPKHH